MGDPMQAVRRMVPATEAAAHLRGMVQQRYELMRESTRRKNKLMAISDEIFPAFIQVFKMPTLPPALAFREQFPTPQALALASLTALQQVRGANRSLSEAKLLALQRLASLSVGPKDPARLRGLVFEHKQVLEELALLQRHLEQLEAEMMQIIENARAGQILLSIAGIGPIQAAMIMAMIGNSANFPRPSQLKSYFGGAPMIKQSGYTLDRVRLSARGIRLMKQTRSLVVWHGIRRKDCEWHRIYER